MTTLTPNPTPSAMTRSKRRKRRWSRRLSRRSGFTLLELLVSATLLIALISVVTPLTVRAGRMWQDARGYRLAANELSNQLEDMTLLSDQERQQALDNWTPSEELLRALPEARITGEVIDDANGKRLRLSLGWRRSASSPPLTMVGWIHPEKN